ncbi:glycosyltransferase family 2 protein [Candidatus Gracilibacteria bacterium]|nr:glycosyltransferase family 2 protein [Candidatus Gracilibacteria bacterium]
MINKISDEVLQDKCTGISCKIKKIQNENPIGSVVFCAYNEENYLLPTLDSFTKIQTNLPIEIIAVNNNSTDRTKEILEQSGIKVINENKKGISYARNTGLNEARGEIIFQTDADTKIPSTWIDSHYQHYFNNDIGGVSGGIKYEDVCILYYLYRFGAIGYHVFLDLIGKGPLCRGGANLSYRKDVASSVGGFTPGCDYGEDILLFDKLSKVSKVKSDKSKKITTITSGRRYKNSSQVIKQIKDKIFSISERISSNEVIPINKTFKDAR